MDRKLQADILFIMEEIKWEAEHPTLSSPRKIALLSSSIKELIIHEEKDFEKGIEKEYAANCA